MKFISIFPVLMLSVSVYVGLYHLVFFLRRREEKFNLMFALSCFLIALYDFFSAGLYNVYSVVDGVIWQTGQFSVLILFAVSMVYFLKYLLGISEKRELIVIRIIPLMMMPVFLILLLTDYGFDINNPSIKYIKYFNVIYYEAAPDLILNILYIFFILIMIWATVIFAKYYRSGESYLKSLLISFILFFLTAINDILVGYNLANNIYLMEYGFLFIILGMDLTIQKKYLDLHNTIETLNITLERQVRERTAELYSAMFELKKNNKKFQELSMIDELTGIPNRRSFDWQLNKDFRHAVRTAGLITILMIDVDYFKRYNDRYGHQEGDNVLVSIAKVLTGSLYRAPDMAARYGGEEFVVILPYTALANGKFIAERILENVRDLNIVNEGGGTGMLTVSIGVCSNSEFKGNTEKELIKCADKALYDAKNSGRNQVKCTLAES